ncbi:MAG: hypothetical protein E7665_04005 [Ruminococcaceae bacterium]|nr:hypothetical protein [Oscillospiraceae bacterium]
MNRIISIAEAVICIIFFLSSCSHENLPNTYIGDTMTTNDFDTSFTEVQSAEQIYRNTSFSPTVYNTEEIKNANETKAGSFEKWKNEVFKNNYNNDDPTDNAVINSPFHSLRINGITVPVYTARCGKGAHSFAWVDITSESDFILKAELELTQPFKKCVILPESREVIPEVNGASIVSYITDTGSFTYTFSKNDTATDPSYMPLTLMVSRRSELNIPKNYNVVNIQPGYHDNDELEFKDQSTVYVIKEGFHSISSIGLPSNSILYIEQGAYIKAEDRINADGSHNTLTAIHADNCSNVKIISRGLLDCGKLQGGDNKYKHVVNTARSKNVTIEGLTIINSNTWTICAYNSENVKINNNLLLSYRTYSDGIMMSECINSSGRYNFVRTGDDAIEFKGTGWWNGTGTVGSNCIYEFNDIWTDKGAGYCLTWESTCSMKNMIFRNNTIGFAQPTWADRNTALDCLLGSNGSSKWSDITFENIEIYHVISPNVINMQIMGNGGNLNDITFRNLTVHSKEESTHAFRMHFSAENGSFSDIKLENINIGGKLITKDDISDKTLFKNEAGEFFNSFSVN